MPSTEPGSLDDNSLNHLDRSKETNEISKTTVLEAQIDGAAKAKRIACVLCRKRKLKCDGTRPTCGTCKRLSHDCAYDEVRKKSGPKRGYVKLLEQRLQQVEHLLKNQDTSGATKDTSLQDATSAYVASTLQQALPNQGNYVHIEDRIQDSQASSANASHKVAATVTMGDADFSWELIGLGLEEPLPPQDVMDELYQIYFTKVHLSSPVVHRPRFLAALNLAPHMRPPVCLRYIMWTLAASTTDKYEGLQEHFYQRARRYAQMDEMKGHGESMITLAHCQAWILICTYEFKQMYFPRAWLSAGKSVRLAQMMQLHRLDGVGLDVKQCLPPPKDWTEREERRRTFWMAFCVDRYASIGTGWPMTIDERDITTNLPADEDAFEKNKPRATGSLNQSLASNGATGLQAMGCVVLTAAMFGRNLLHLHRPGPDDRDDDLNGGFWNRHRSIEQILLQTSLNLPDHLRLPSGIADPNAVFANMCLHTSVICLHQAAIFKAEKYRMPMHVGNESKIRCATAAAEIASIMRMISHMDLSAMNPFISFCVYVAARVFVQYLKTRPKDQQMNSSLQFLLQAMQALRRRNPLTESFLVQIDLDLESAGIEGLKQKPYQPVNPRLASIPVNTDSVSCSPIFEVRETQNPNAAINTFGNTTFNTNHPSYQAMVNTGFRDTQYSESNHVPPFHMSNIDSIDLNTARNAPYVPPQMAAQSQDFIPAGFAFHDDNEMDLSGSGDPSQQDQPSPATISSQSRGGSTSHSSFSPSTNEHNIAYRTSPNPKPLPLKHTNSFPTFPSTSSSSTNDMPSNHLNHHLTGNNLSTVNTSNADSEDLFNPTFTTSALSADEQFNHEFLMDSEWDFPQSTGLTAMSDGNWNQMLESVTMGWDVSGLANSHSRSHPHDGDQ